MNSSSLSLRSRPWTRSKMCCLCGHVMHPAVASSVTKAWLGSIRSSKWTPLTLSLRISASSSGQSLPGSARTSAFQTNNEMLLYLIVTVVVLEGVMVVVGFMSLYVSKSILQIKQCLTKHHNVHIHHTILLSNVQLETKQWNWNVRMKERQLHWRLCFSV